MRSCNRRRPPRATRSSRRDVDYDDNWLMRFAPDGSVSSTNRQDMRQRRVRVSKNWSAFVVSFHTLRLSSFTRMDSGRWWLCQSELQRIHFWAILSGQPTHSLKYNIDWQWTLNLVEVTIFFLLGFTELFWSPIHFSSRNLLTAHVWHLIFLYFPTRTNHTLFYLQHLKLCHW